MGALRWLRAGLTLCVGLTSACGRPSACEPPEIVNHAGLDALGVTELEVVAADFVSWTAPAGACPDTIEVTEGEGSSRSGAVVTVGAEESSLATALRGELCDWQAQALGVDEGLVRTCSFGLPQGRRAEAAVQASCNRGVLSEAEDAVLAELYVRAPEDPIGLLSGPTEAEERALTLSPFAERGMLAFVAALEGILLLVPDEERSGTAELWRLHPSVAEEAPAPELLASGEWELLVGGDDAVVVGSWSGEGLTSVDSDGLLTELEPPSAPVDLSRAVLSEGWLVAPQILDKDEELLAWRAGESVSIALPERPGDRRSRVAGALHAVPGGFLAELLDATVEVSGDFTSIRTHGFHLSRFDWASWSWTEVDEGLPTNFFGSGSTLGGDLFFEAGTGLGGVWDDLEGALALVPGCPEVDLVMVSDGVVWGMEQEEGGVFRFTAVASAPSR